MEDLKNVPTVIWYDNEILISNVNITPTTVCRIIDMDNNKELYGKFLMEDDIIFDFVEEKNIIVPGTVEEKLYNIQIRIDSQINKIIDMNINELFSYATDLKDLLTNVEIIEKVTGPTLAYKVRTPFTEQLYIVSASGMKGKDVKWRKHE